MFTYMQCANKVSYRRYWLNRLLVQQRSLMKGVVVDLGGKRKRNPYFFQPPEAEAVLWLYLNIDLNSRPDVVADVMHAPISGGSADIVICTEVLEHLPDPQACVEEAFRILRPSGVFIGSAPF